MSCGCCVFVCQSGRSLMFDVSVLMGSGNHGKGTFLCSAAAAMVLCGMSCSCCSYFLYMLGQLVQVVDFQTACVACHYITDTCLVTKEEMDAVVCLECRPAATHTLMLPVSRTGLSIRFA